MTVAIAIAALVISLSTFVTSYWRDRRDLLLSVLHGLSTVDQQRGRRLTHQQLAELHKGVSDLDADEFDLINNALAGMNTMAFYYRRRYVPRKAAMEFWAGPVVGLLEAGEQFLAYRDTQRKDGREQWPELRAFGEAARRHLRKQRQNEARVADGQRSLGRLRRRLRSVVSAEGKPPRQP
jgi:hypothetical protein